MSGYVTEKREGFVSLNLVEFISAVVKIGSSESARLLNDPAHK